jgi:hypothetical protein
MKSRQSTLLSTSINKKFCGAFAALLASFALAQPAHALGKPSIVSFQAAGPGSVSLVKAGRAAPIYVDPADHAGVLRAAEDLQGDIEKVGSVRPVLNRSTLPSGADVVIIGTLGKSALIDGLVASGKLDVSGIKGKWEGYLVQTVSRPMPGVERALVVAGSDKRGAIYGIYEISEQIGVSPWHFWADVPVNKRTRVSIAAPQRIDDAPVVKYRGIFLNDEAPALTGWVKEKYGDYNSRFYEKVFELILRLRGNYLWPAMWNNAFYDDDKANGKLADDYGIVMGTSHHEPMMRAHQEWGRYGKGPWDYSRNADTLARFWTEGARSTKSFEKVVTLGMRGDGDEPMSEESNVSLLEKIVRDQRGIIAREVDPDVTKVPQLWALYKEVQDYYEKGMRVPDDVTLLWCDDNWGNIRRLPTMAERKRPGGAGVYYHFDYVGGPRSYKWLNVTPIPKIWEQMHLAWKYQADRLWIVNVGDLKPMEVPIEFFLTYAWNPAKWPAERLSEYLPLWAEREFGKEYAADIADIVAKYTKYNGRRKPEQLEPGTYSLVNYNEAERVVAEYKAIAARAEQIYARLPQEKRDAFFQLVLHPAKAGAIVNEMYAASAFNRLYAAQGRASANDAAERVRALFRMDAELTRQYHEDLAGGKWNHMMSQLHLGYTFWNQPQRNVMPPVSEIQTTKEAEMGVAAEGAEYAWPRWGQSGLTLPALNPFDQQPRFIDVFNRGEAPFEYKITADQPWVTISHPGGTVRRDQRVLVNVRWAEVPADAEAATLNVAGPRGARMQVKLPLAKLRSAEKGAFVETNGVVSIEAADHARAVAPKGRQWLLVPDHGRTGSGMTTLPVDAPALSPGRDGMRLEYRMQVATTGKVTVQTILAPTLKFQPGQGFRFAVSIDDETPQIVNVHADESDRHWSRIVSDGAAVFTTTHTIDKPGAKTLNVWAIDPGLVVQKMVVDMGGLKPSYLGPPESPRAP